MSVIIVGGGMAGATLALALSNLTQGRLAIDLVEAKLPEEGRHPGFDGRSIALALGTCQKLDSIGVWPALNDNAEAITSILVSDKGRCGRVNLSAEDYKLPAFGYVVELYNAGQALFSLLKRHANIRVHCPAQMVAVQRTQQQVEITLDNGDRLSGQLAVAADGSHSPLATALNMTWRQSDYGQIAVIANVMVSASKTGQAFERFTSHGPLALLPMTQNRYSLVWCHDIVRKDEIMSWTEQRFISELQREFGWRMGEFEKVGQRHCYPLSLRCAGQSIGHRLALVGNASQTLHPIAGQGFNLGLRDVITLAQVISRALSYNQDLGGYTVLSRYQQARREDRRFTVGLTDNMVKLFADSSPFFAVPRSVAMSVMESSLFLKGQLVQRMLGQFKR